MQLSKETWQDLMDKNETLNNKYINILFKASWGENC